MIFWKKSEGERGLETPKVTFLIREILDPTRTIRPKIENTFADMKDVVIHDVYDAIDGRKTGFSVLVESLPPKNNEDREKILARKDEVATILDNLLREAAA